MIKIRFIIDGKHVSLSAKKLAESAFLNDIDLDTLLFNLDKLGSESTSPRTKIQKWREEVLFHYKKLISGRPPVS